MGVYEDSVSRSRIKDHCCSVLIIWHMFLFNLFCKHIGPFVRVKELRHFLKLRLDELEPLMVIVHDRFLPNVSRGRFEAGKDN